MLEQITGVLRLDANTFEQIEADTNATSQATIVVVIVAILSGIGSGIDSDSFVVPFIGAIITSLIGWVAWSAVTYFVGTSLFGGNSDIGQMLRVIGFAQAPQALLILRFIPILGGIIAFAAGIWSLVAAFIAIRQGLDLDNVRAILTIIIGGIVYLIIAFIVGLVLGIGALGLGIASGALGG